VGGFVVFERNASGESELLAFHTCGGWGCVHSGLEKQAPTRNLIPNLIPNMIRHKTGSKVLWPIHDFVNPWRDLFFGCVEEVPSCVWGVGKNETESHPKRNNAKSPTNCLTTVSGDVLLFVVGTRLMVLGCRHLDKIKKMPNSCRFRHQLVLQSRFYPMTSSAQESMTSRAQKYQTRHQPRNMIVVELTSVGVRVTTTKSIAQSGWTWLSDACTETITWPSMNSLGICDDCLKMQSVGCFGTNIHIIIFFFFFFFFF